MCIHAVYITDDHNRTYNRILIFNNIIVLVRNNKLVHFVKSF